MLKSKQRFKSEKRVFTEDDNKIALSAKDNKKIQLIDSIETYAYGANEEITHKKKKLNAPK